jgi:hypothetical protein
MTQTSSLEQKVLDAFPSGQYALLGMLRLLEVCESEEVETAAVECTWQPRLRINPWFVDSWANTSEKLFMLILHELHHVLLGHTTLFPRATPVDNLVFDAVINSLLCRMFPAREYTSMFTDFYSDDRFPECLLRPPRMWNPRRPARIPRALAAPKYESVGEVYGALYSETGADYHELFNTLTDVLKGRGKSKITLLGTHSEGQAEQEPMQMPPALLASVRQIVEHWPQPPDPIRGRSYSSLTKDCSVQPRRVLSNRSLLRDLLRKVGGNKAGTAGSVSSVAPVVASTPVPALDRRSLVLRSLGCTPMFYRKEIEWRGHRGQDRVHIYLDVSGSIGDLKPALYGAVLDTSEYVYPKIHLFSTEVADVSIADLRSGRCETTGGTDITCVAEHIRRNRVKRAVLVTDGYTGTPRGTVEEVLKRTLLGVALTPHGQTRDDLSGVTDHWTQLNSEAK